MNIEPLHEEFGAEIRGVKLVSGLEGRIFNEIEEAINRYSLLLFRK